MNFMIDEWVAQLRRPQPDSHKGQNGKALVIGGSDLFHAASQWSFAVLSRFVDMTFYASTTDNNELLQRRKEVLHDGVVIRRRDVPTYAREADIILIGPGMRRDVPTSRSEASLRQLRLDQLTEAEWEADTTAVTAALLQAFPRKRWVIDAGALQVVRAAWLPKHALLTPHRLELERVLVDAPALLERVGELAAWQAAIRDRHWTAGESLPATLVPKKPPASLLSWFHDVAEHLHAATVIIKGPVDIIWDQRTTVAVIGGNAGLTKGGTGDVLAGLVTGFAATSPALPSAVVSSFLNKQAAHDLYKRQNTMFNTSDLVAQIPLTWRTLAGDHGASVRG